MILYLVEVVDIWCIVLLRNRRALSRIHEVMSFLHIAFVEQQVALTEVKRIDPRVPDDLAAIAKGPMPSHRDRGLNEP